MTTIYSLVTKPINQNIAVIRISGQNTFKIISKMFNEEFEKNENTILFRKLYLEKEFVDDVLLLFFVSPNSFTGEDVIEIQCHGSMFIVNKILLALKNLNCFQAKPGEFSERAFLNKKIDLLQASSINTIINSETIFLQQEASKNLNKNQSKFIDLRKSYLEDIISRIQVNIDYPENDDLPKYNLENLIIELLDFQKELDIVIQNSKNLIKYDKGIVVTLVGLPNTGKSTLMNTILNEDRSIVSSKEGTTRDIVESTIFLKNYKLTFQDTAGLRESDDEVETIGILKTKQAISTTDIIVFLIDPTKNINEQKDFFKKQLPPNFSKPIIFCYTKKDLIKLDKKISITAKFDDINDLLNNLIEIIEENFFNLKNQDTYLTSNEQIFSLEKVKFHIDTALSFLQKSNFVDVIFLELEQSLRELKIMSGEIISPDYIYDLFSKFCLGK